ncbi:hypothetical protein SAMN04488105_116128 [Salipiger thiooxidans]|uniref:Uncharacterized protein n=1 Tax=Salipiger thiooxidans TaxID=282683 RepID=A0A1G7JZ14_9RHOB|nr:hypothetical protein [Salipiger thiooxidans]SDF30085.1 hypothetical protein SAMN04488105_116128 [Salipiger thiooxidans]
MHSEDYFQQTCAEKPKGAFWRFTGPSYSWSPAIPHEESWTVHMQPVFDRYLQSLDELPHHFQLHFMHAAEIIGYKHPDPRCRARRRALPRRACRCPLGPQALDPGPHPRREPSHAGRA